MGVQQGMMTERGRRDIHEEGNQGDKCSDNVSSQGSHGPRRRSQSCAPSDEEILERKRLHTENNSGRPVLNKKEHECTRRGSVAVFGNSLKKNTSSFRNKIRES